MHLPTLHLFAISALCCTTLSALDVPSRIVRVEVYQGQARVTRSFEVQLDPNAQATLTFAGLPNTDFGTAQIAVTGGAPIQFGRVTWDSRFTQDDESQALKDLRTRLEALDLEKENLTHAYNRANANFARMQQLVDSVRKGIEETGERELYELAKTAWDETDAIEAQVFTQKLAIDAQLKQLSRDRTEAENAYKERLAQEQRASTELFVEARGAGGTTRGTLSYVVSGVQWQPTYIVRAQPNAGLLELNYQASIYQSTGEDWKEVELALNTGQPGLGGEPEEPDTIQLERIQGRGYDKSVGYSSAPSRAKMEEEELYVLSAFSVEQTKFSSSSVGFEAKLPMHVSIESGKQAAVFPITTETFKPEFWSEAIPLTAETAFLMAKFDNGLPLPLLAGETQIYVDGALNGTGEMEMTLPGGEIELGLGQNQNVTIDRTTLLEEGESRGFIGRSRIETRKYQTKVTNNMSVAQRVVIRDRVPVSTDGDIVVELLSPKSPEMDPETGLFSYEMNLKPGQSAQLLTHFTVKYPNDWEITGGY